MTLPTLRNGLRLWLRSASSPGIPGECWGEGDFEHPCGTAALGCGSRNHSRGGCATRNRPHPRPLPEYQERGRRAAMVVDPKPSLPDHFQRLGFLVLSPPVTITLSELAAAIGAELVGDGSLQIDSASTLEAARPGQVSFLSNPKYGRQLEATKASAVVVSPHVKAAGVNLLKHKNPYYAFMQAVVKLHGYRRHPHTGVHPRATVDPAATIGEGSVLYPGVYVGPARRSAATAFSIRMW